jgi:hypothetical protein
MSENQPINWEQVPFSVLLVHSMNLLLPAWDEIDHTR